MVASLSTHSTRLTDAPGVAGFRWRGIESQLQIVAAFLLAVVPWVRALSAADYADQGLIRWPLWVIAVGAHAIWLCLRPPKVGRLLSAASLLLILGLIFIQALVVYRDVVTARLSIDYLAMASWIHTAARDIQVSPENVQRMWWAKYFPPGSAFDSTSPVTTYLQGYFDPIIPLLNRIFDVTTNPFLMMGFYATSIVSASLVIWRLTSSQSNLQCLQTILPTAFLFHPAVGYSLQMEYHNDGIPISLLVLGSYYFFSGRQLPAFLFLLGASLTKISYWPSFLLLGLLYATRRDWRWSAAYLGCGFVALAVYHAIQPVGVPPSVVVLLPGLGNTTTEVLSNLVLSPGLWLPRALEPSRWYFLACIVLPWAWMRQSYWQALLPILPFIAFTLLDALGTRSQLVAPYTLEYLAFIAAATLVALRSAPRRAHALTIVSLTIAAAIPFVVSGPWGVVGSQMVPWGEPQNQATRWGEALGSATAGTETYNREVAFGTCAVGDEPVLATQIFYPSYIRGDISKLWLDQGLLLKATRGRKLPHFGTLANPLRLDAFGRGPLEDLKASDDPAYRDAVSSFYHSLNDQLPVRVATAVWEYRGGARLAECAAQFGYQADR